MTWPHAQGDWGTCLAEVESTYVDLVRAIARREAVVITCLDQSHRAHVQERLYATDVNLSRVAVQPVPFADTWTRDYGPVTILRDGKPELLDFTFNGWGNRYPSGLDNQVTRRLHELGAFGDTSLHSCPLVLEGGNLETDGEGTLLASRRSMQAHNRNPDLTPEAVENQLRTLLGIHRILWLEHGELAGDDTDGHIDMLARFCNAGTIAYAQCEDRDHPNYDALATMEKELASFRTRGGNPYELVPIPSPSRQFAEDGRPLPASYANFLIINQAVLVPTYDAPADEIAMTRLSQCFPDREIEGIPCLSLIRQNGSLHCATMQLPAGVL